MLSRFQIIYSIAAGAALVALFGILGMQALNDYRRFGNEPLRGDLPAALSASRDGRQWVTIEGAPWRCEAGVRAGESFFSARAASGEEVVARFDHDVSCREVNASLTGVIEPISPGDYQRVKASGLAQGELGSVRMMSVCTNCGKDNARLGVILCTLFVLLGFAIYPIRLALGRWKGSLYESTHAALHAPASDEAQAVRQLRLRGLVLAGGAALGLTLGQNYLLDGLIPVPWLSWPILGLAAVYLFFPSWMRARLAKSQAR